MNDESDLNKTSAFGVTQWRSRASRLNRLQNIAKNDIRYASTDLAALHAGSTELHSYGEMVRSNRFESAMQKEHFIAE